MSGEWYTVNDSESVEQKFCIPGEILHYCSVTVAGENLICRVAFGDKITTTLMGYQTVQYRRLTNRSFKEAGDVADVDRYITQWIWYWQDNDGRWKMFEPDSLQHTLEAKFLAKQPTYLYSRENYTWEYVIDFESMTQQNLTTGTSREIRRRPLFVSYRDVQRNFTPQRLSPPQVIDVGLPPSWVPWDVAHPFELVQLSYTDTEFIKFHLRITPEKPGVVFFQKHAFDVGEAVTILKKDVVMQDSMPDHLESLGLSAQC